MALGFGGLSPKLSDTMMSLLWASGSAGQHGDRRPWSWLSSNKPSAQSLWGAEPQRYCCYISLSPPSLAHDTYYLYPKLSSALYIIVLIITLVAYMSTLPEESP